MSPFISQIRAYSVPDGYANRTPYEAIVTVVHHSDTTVYLCAAVGNINMHTWSVLMGILRSQGVTTVMYERHGKMKTRNLTAEKEVAE